MAAQFPHLDLHGQVAYFTDRSGKRWRVYDVSFGPPHAALGKFAIHDFASARAKQRTFVSADPDAARHLYTFAPTDSRELTVERLEEQLRRSSVFYRKRLQTANLDPR